MIDKGGVTGILVQGSNGEAQHVSHEERKLAISTTRQVLNDNGFSNVVVIAGTGAQSTRETIKLCVDAKDAGAAYALVLTPSTWPPQMSKANIIRFHREVCAKYTPNISLLNTAVTPKRSGCGCISHTYHDL